MFFITNSLWSMNVFKGDIVKCLRDVFNSDISFIAWILLGSCYHFIFRFLLSIFQKKVRTKNHPRKISRLVTDFYQLLL